MNLTAAARWASAAAMAQVARRAATQLSGGGTATMPSADPVSGGPGAGFGAAGMPVSGPGGPGSASPGGTRMFTGAIGGPGAVSGPPSVSGPPGGYGAPTSPVTGGFGAPGSPAGPAGGQFARGAAGVAPPPSPQETSYNYLRPGAATPGGPPARTGGGQSSLNQHRTLIALAAGLVALVVLIGVVALVLSMSGNDENGGQGNPPASTASQPATPSGKQSKSPSRATSGSQQSNEIVIDCKALVGQQLSLVRFKLQQFEVDVQEVPSTVRKNQVVEITPCRAQAGDTITVKVSTGVSGSPSKSAVPQPSCTDALGNSRACASSRQP